MNRACQTQVTIIDLPTITQRARKRWVIFAAASVVILALAVPLSAQTFRGNILGTVTDPNGAVIPEVTVTAKNVGTGIERSTVTDSSGNYTLAELQTGTYVVTAQKPGFAKYQIDNVVVEVTSEKRVDVELSVAGSEAVVLVAPAAQVETTTNTLGGTISTKAVADLPVNGRDFTKFLVLVPGATGDPSGATDSPGSFGLFSANGNRGRANNYLLDGTDMNDGYRNLPAINEAGVFGTPATILPIEAISEVAVLSNFEAEYGRNSGAVVNIVTKSGTNEFHGSVFEFFRNNASTRETFLIPNLILKPRFAIISSADPSVDRSFVSAHFSTSLTKASVNALASIQRPVFPIPGRLLLWEERRIP